MWPKNVLYIILESLFFVPLRARWRALRNHDKKSIGSPKNIQLYVPFQISYLNFLTFLISFVCSFSFVFNYFYLLAKVCLLYLVPWIETFFCSTKQQLVTFHEDSHEFWNYEGSKVSSSVHRNVAPTSTPSLLAVSRHLHSLILSKSSLAVVQRVTMPEKKTNHVFLNTFLFLSCFVFWIRLMVTCRITLQ